ncbi:hypothetical protein D3C86_1774990 [compost metagenome]
MQTAQGNLYSSAVCAKQRLTVGHKVFGRGHYMVFAETVFTGTLQAVDKSYTDFAHQVSVFTISFFKATPSGIPQYPEHGGITVVDTQCPGFLCDYSRNTFYQ